MMFSFNPIHIYTFIFTLRNTKNEKQTKIWVSLHNTIYESIPQSADLEKEVC